MHWLRIDGRVPCGFSVSFCFRVRFGRRAWRIDTIREGLKSTPNNTRRIHEGLSRLLGYARAHGRKRPESSKLSYQQSQMAEKQGKRKSRRSTRQREAEGILPLGRVRASLN